MGDFLPKSEFNHVQDINFSLTKNGENVQSGNSKDMIFSFDAIIAHVSQYFTLKIGDLIFTGTPAGVGPVKMGDELEASIEDKKLLKIQIR